MASEIRYPTGDTGTGANFTDTRSWILRTAQDLVVYVVESETEITAEAAVREWAMVQTPTPPTNTDRKLRETDRTVVKEVGRRRRNDGLGGWGNIPEVSHRCPQEKVGSEIVDHRP